MKVEFLAKVIDCKLTPEIIKGISTAVSNLNGKIIKITIEESKKKRSLNQNAYYFGVVVQAVLQMFIEAGNDVDDEEVHLFLKREVGKLTKIITDKQGNKSTILQSTARLSTIEFEQYLERIRAWAAGLGVVIPLPRENI